MQHFAMQAETKEIVQILISNKHLGIKFNLFLDVKYLLTSRCTLVNKVRKLR